MIEEIINNQYFQILLALSTITGGYAAIKQLFGKNITDNHVITIGCLKNTIHCLTCGALLSEDASTCPSCQSKSPFSKTIILSILTNEIFQISENIKNRKYFSIWIFAIYYFLGHVALGLSILLVYFFKKISSLDMILDFSLDTISILIVYAISFYIIYLSISLMASPRRHLKTYEQTFVKCGDLITSSFNKNNEFKYSNINTFLPNDKLSLNQLYRSTLSVIDQLNVSGKNESDYWFDNIDEILYFIPEFFIITFPVHHYYGSIHWEAVVIGTIVLTLVRMNDLKFRFYNDKTMNYTFSHLSTILKTRLKEI